MKIATILDEAFRLGRIHKFDEDHAQQVAKLALCLFDELQSLHTMGNSERIWLKLACLWHDIGKDNTDTVHNKASRDIIVKEANLPFKKRVHKMIGLVARYHRGGIPNDTHKYFRRLGDESKQYVRKLAALLRLADSLDADHNQVVHFLSCSVRRDRVILYIFTAEELQLKKIIRKADLFEQVFGRRIEVRSAVAVKRLLNMNRKINLNFIWN